MKDIYKRLIMPNHIVVKDGLACGDRVILSYDFTDTKMMFNISSEGCECCSKVCEYLQENLNYNETDVVEQFCYNIVNNSDVCDEVMKDIVSSRYNSRRKECCIAPIKLLLECVKDNKKSEGKTVNLYVDKMDCDACAIRENVSWLYQKPKHIHGGYTISFEKRKMLMRLGRICVDDMNLDDVKKLYFILNDDDFEFMEEYKLLPMVYQNLKRMNVLQPNDERWRLLVYQRQRTIMAQNEIEDIKKYIEDRKIKAYWVKGTYTQKFYKDISMRNLTDFDLLVTDENDAFDLIFWLLENDYKIFPDSFSLKKMEQNGVEKYTGHLHFQKIINLQYRLIIDINFTGFPMIRVASYTPLIVNREIAIESMIVVCLCHFFKHKEAFIKDINDFYLMLLNPQIRTDVLINEIKSNGLERLFAILFTYVCTEYIIPDDLNHINDLKEKYLINEYVEFDEWPYSQESVNLVKKREFEIFANTRVDVERLYLYPTIIFSRKIDIRLLKDNIGESLELTKEDFNCFTENLVQVKVDNIYFIICPIGIFLEMKDYYNEEMKSRIREYLYIIMDKVNCDWVDIPYAIAFTDKWLDTEKE